MQEERERKRRQRLKSEGKLVTPPDVVEEIKKPARRVISHFVMNLPDSAITFLDAFRGIFISDGSQDLGELYNEMPMIHCHCFTRESELENAKRDIYEVNDYFSVSLFLFTIYCRESKNKLATGCQRIQAYIWFVQ